MDQKNTIVKCKAHPDCLFNYNGVCDNYVINIGANRECESYVETELIESVIQDPVKIGLALKEISKQMDVQRGQRARCNFYEDVCDYEPFLTKTICSQCKYNTHGNLCSRKNITSNGIWTCWEKKE